MDVKKINATLQNYWNTVFNVDTTNLGKMDQSASDIFDNYCKYVGDNCEKILDVGTGYGNGLIAAKYYGSKVQYGLGIDPSVNAINIANKLVENENITGIEFKVGDDTLLNTIDSESFDGIICSNVLDVIPEVTANKIIKNIKRILKPNGLFFLKLNFYLSKDLITRLKMEKLNKNSYAINGVLRAVNHTTKAWINKFSGFEVVKVDEYERIKNGPKDRIILFRKLDK